MYLQVLYNQLQDLHYHLRKFLRLHRKVNTYLLQSQIVFRQLQLHLL